MNKEYMKINDVVFVTEENGSTYQRRYIDNIEEILKLENREEILENIIKDDEKKLVNKKDSLKEFKKIRKTFWISIPLISLIASLLVSVKGSLFILYALKVLAITMLIVSTVGVSCFIPINFNIKLFSKEIKGLENKISKANEEKLSIQNKLRKIKKESKNEERDYKYFLKIANEINNSDIKEELIKLKEKPSFVKIEDSYLLEIEKQLNSAYNQGIDKYVNSKKKTKLLKNN